MNDTPRTDEVELHYRRMEDADAPSYVAPAEFARQLERIASGYRGLCNPMTMSEESFQKLRALDKQFDALLGEG